MEEDGVAGVVGDALDPAAAGGLAGPVDELEGAGGVAAGEASADGLPSFFWVEEAFSSALASVPGLSLSE